MASNTDFKIFSANRIKYNELHQDAFNYIQNVYKTNGQEFTMASPFAQIINVVLHLGRMILFYIENMITELNIETAFHDRSIRGLATLTGHTPSSGIAARGSLYMSYNLSSKYVGETVVYKNYSKIKNISNGLTYLAVLPNNDLRLTVGTYDSKIEIPVIQGQLKYQQATATGELLQSFNFANKSDGVVDNFFMNVYVNNERWAKVESLLDMGYNQKCCMIKPSVNGGIDVFFGTGINGAIPEEGNTILFEYLISSGPNGNIYENSEDNYWEFDDCGYLSDGESINMNEIYNLTSASEILFGADKESIAITKSIAPYTSRSFVLANATNYKYFLTKLNMFSIIDAFSGFNTVEDEKIEKEYTDAKNEYNSLKEEYLAQINLTGRESEQAVNVYERLEVAKNKVDSLKVKYDDSKLDDNIIYLYLVPDIRKRINIGENYFTCGIDRFKLTDDEKLGILNLIEDSGQKILTVDNKILDPIFVKFAINIFIQMWSNYNFNNVKTSIISAVSEYLITNKRRDRIPVSDLVKLVENVPGVDSVSIFFDADVKNEQYYEKGNYGIDEYGDIVLLRSITDSLGNKIQINDLLPLFRGNFTSPNGVDYSDDINSLTGVINVTLRGKSSNKN